MFNAVRFDCGRWVSEKIVAGQAAPRCDTPPQSLHHRADETKSLREDPAAPYTIASTRFAWTRWIPYSEYSLKVVVSEQNG
eukprot:scaffold10909_cov172-Amphora_coffeaeformis.AAC.1